MNDLNITLTLTKTREEAYRAFQEAATANQKAHYGGEPVEVVNRLHAAEQRAWQEYRGWVEADSFAAMAGALD